MRAWQSSGQPGGQHGQALGRCLMGRLRFQELHQLRSRAHGSAARVAIAKEEHCQLCLCQSHRPSQPLSAQQWLNQESGLPFAVSETPPALVVAFKGNTLAFPSSRCCLASCSTCMQA